MEKLNNVYNTGNLRNKLNELVDGLEDAKWKGGIVSQDILPSNPSSISLGAENNKFKALYADEVHISQNTLYIGDTPILGTDQDTINIKGDPDQSILMKTTGIGSTQLSSENGILLNTNGTTANININADGTNSEITMNAKTRVSVTAPEIKIEGNTTITDLTVTGTTTTVNSTNLAVKDNLIELNSGETGSGVSLGTAGIKVNRGDALPYLIQFDEADDMFKVGEQGNLETIASQEYVDEKIKSNGGGISVGYEYFTMNPNIPTGWLPLFGGEYSREAYKDLWAWVQTQTGYLITEAEWQEKATANEGNVPFYSTGDGSTTFRVPSLKCHVQGANGVEKVGSYLAAGLPNIEGYVANLGLNSNEAKADYSGAFVPSASTNDYGDSSRGNPKTNLAFDASASNSIYGNSDTVQPPSIVGMWLVKAFGTVSNVGNQDIADVSAGLTRLETEVVPITRGGTGATTAKGALTNLGIQYSTTDLTAGTSTLATGKIYLVYE